MGPSATSQFLGQFPKHVEPHGHSVHMSAEYVRTRPEVLLNVQESCVKSAAVPSKVYQNLTTEAENDQECPRNKQQVKHCALKFV